MFDAVFASFLGARACRPMLTFFRRFPEALPMRRACPVVLSTPVFVALLACGLTGQRTAPSADDTGAAGTYEVRICRGECSPGEPENEIAHGRIVIEAASYPVTDVPEPAQSYFRRYARWLLVRDDLRRDPNACFVLARHPGAESYAGSSPVGLVEVEADATGETLTTRLHQSPDAGYAARFQIRGHELHGRGRSWGGGDAAVDFPPDTIMGRRVGPPDRGLCIRAAEAELARRQP